MIEEHFIEQQREEHAHIGGVSGKKVFNIDSDGNVLNFSGVTVYQGETWDVTSNSGVTVFQGSQPFNSLGTVTIGSQATVSAYGSQGEVFSQDASTLAMEVVDYEHHEIHGGSHYFLDGFNELGNANVHDYMVRTPDTTDWAHFLFNVNSSTILTIQIYEGASVVSGASLSVMTPINNNRNSANESGLTLWSLPSVASTGTLIASQKWGSRTAGEISRNKEVILKQNETYLWRMTSGAASNVINFNVNWYEHEDKK